jgi:hypothetical protein
MNKMSTDQLPEVIFPTSRKLTKWISAEMAKGRLRKLGPKLYTANLTDDPAAILRRNVWRIVAGYCPGALIADRTALEAKPAADGSVFVIAERARSVDLPGLKIRPRPGAGPLASDRQFMTGLHLASRPRALLENLRPSRARGGVARTLARAEIEELLERDLAAGGEAALNRIRDEARPIAKALALQDEMTDLDRLIGALLGTRTDKLSAPVAIARAEGRPFDPRRIERFVRLAEQLAGLSPVIRRTPTADAANLAFFEAYFSNFIEGTEFEVEEARDIVFNNAIPKDRPEDAHDIIGTFQIVSNTAEMSLRPASVEDLIELVRRRQASVMSGRPDMRPGQFKDRANRAGGTTFVAPDLVNGTLEQGYEIYRSLAEPFARAVFMMFLIAEVHPFADGNGRVARIMMNAELVAAGEQRIIIPIVYRNSYIAALKAISNDGSAEPLIRVLDFAQRYALAVPFDTFDKANFVLARTNAFLKPEEAEEAGVRLTIPASHLLLEADSLFPNGAK